jgi:hypothetical protein
VVRNSRATFNPPPNWPVPQNFRPYPGWEPDPAWGMPPPGWAMWVTTETKPHTVRWVLVAVGLFVVCAATSCVALVAKGSSEGARQRAVGAPPVAASCRGRTYPEQAPERDVCANPAGTVELPGLAITASPLHRDGSDKLCQDVTFVNQSDTTVAFRLLDWQLRAPSGAVQRSVVATAGDLSSDQLNKGRQKHGTMCFDPLGGKGTFVTVYQVANSAVRGIWLSTVD